MIWDVLCWIFGIICIVGPICLIFWYIGGAKKQLASLHDDK